MTRRLRSEYCVSPALVLLLLGALMFLPLLSGTAKASPSADNFAFKSSNIADTASPHEASLTIYNQNFAVVRQMFPLQLIAGVNAVHFTETTAHLETDSVILRDPSGQHHLQVLEQSYRADPVSEQWLLALNEGKIIEFETYDGKEKRIVKGKVIRSGYVPQYAQTGPMQPIIEVDGRLHFGLPGTPIFPSLGEDTILKPTLDWQLRTDKPGDFNAELSYITGGMSWHADYNLVAEPKGDSIDLIGWVTFNNQSGKAFRNAQVKLMAGDVNKIENANGRMEYARKAAMAADALSSVVSEHSFDEFHLYSLQNPVTLRDHETKQVEFIRATSVKAQRLYIYDGARLDQYYGWNSDNIRQNQEYGTQSNSKVFVMQQFKNSSANNLGMALPKGRLRFYRRDANGNLEFTGENEINHTPKDETVRVYTGNSFDLVGERKRTDYHVDSSKRTIDESFEIKLRNHKDEAAEIRVVEHLNRCVNWQMVESSFKFEKTNSQTAEFRIPVPANGERTLRYSVHYSW